MNVVGGMAIIKVINYQSDWSQVLVCRKVQHRRQFEQTVDCCIINDKTWESF